MQRSWVAGLIGRFTRILGALMISVGLMAALAVPRALAYFPLPAASAPVLADPSFDAQSFSCASSTLCIALSTYSAGQKYSVFTGTTWSTPAAPADTSELIALSCAPGTTFCMATDDKSNAVIYSGGSWSAPVSDSTQGTVGALSCPTSSFCLGVADIAEQFTYNGSTWTSAGAGPDIDTVTGLSCASSSLCVAVGSDGTGSVYDGTSWSTPQQLVAPVAGQSVTPTAVSCAPGTTTCVVVDSAGAAFAYTPSTGVSSQSVDDNGLQSVSCIAGTGSAVDCVALDDDGGAVSTTAPTSTSTWSSAVDDQLSPGADAFVSCTSSSACDALDGLGFSSAAAGPTASRWTSAPTLGSAGFSAASCAPDTTDCVAVDGAGQVVVSNGSSDSAPAQVDNGVPLTAVSCASTTACVAGDDDGNAVMIDPGGTSGITPLAPGTPIVAVSCPTTTFCDALTTAGSVFTYNGSSWGHGTPIDSAGNTPDGLSCANQNDCVAIDLAGNAISWNGTSWSAPTLVDTATAGLDTISCSDITYCEAGDLDGRVLEDFRGSWGSPEAIGSGSIYAVSCGSSTFCPLATSGGIAYYWTDQYVTLSGDPDVTALACSSTAYCFGVDADGDTLGIGSAPASVSLPAITGTAAAGSTLTASTGTFAEPPGQADAYSYQWLSCTATTHICTAISGATNPTYTVSPADESNTLEVTVTDSNHYGPTPATSAATGVVPSPAVTLPAPSVTTAPEISGTAAVGRTLVASTGVFSGTGTITYSYQWYLCVKTCTAITGATKATYPVSAADIGKSIAVVVTAHDPGGSVPAVSKLTGIIAAPAATLSAWTSPLLHVSATAGRLTSIKRAKGYTATFRAQVPGTVKITWTITEKIAHSKKTRTVTLARASAKTKAPSTQLKVKLTATGVKLLKTLGREKVTATATFTYAYGTSTRTYTARRVLTLSH